MKYAAQAAIETFVFLCMKPNILFTCSCMSIVLFTGVAGCCAKTTIAPLDRVKILLQGQNPHYKHLGKLLTNYQTNKLTLTS